MRRREPDFENMKKVLARQVPDRPVLYDLLMNEGYCERLSGMKRSNDELTNVRRSVEAFANAGYDYVNVCASDFSFKVRKDVKYAESFSLNEGAIITDWESFEKYEWPDPKDFSDERLINIKPYLPGNMKIMVGGPMGVLENVIALMGYENLCFALYEEPELAKAVVDHVGERLLALYTSAVQYETVGFAAIGDDLGFNTQTMLSPEDLRKYIFPWHRRIVEVSHKYNKPCILHACGYFESIIDDIIDMGFDARHSYEDNIMPVEEAYDKYGDRIAILGGIDMDFICRETPENIARRCRKMLEKAEGKGGYALGTGNSVPDYIPFENYMAMVNVAMEY